MLKGITNEKTLFLHIIMEADGKKYLVYIIGNFLLACRLRVKLSKSLYVSHRGGKFDSDLFHGSDENFSLCPCYLW